MERFLLYIAFLSLLLFSGLSLTLTCGDAVSKYRQPPPNASKERVEKWQADDKQMLSYLSTSIPEALQHTGATSFDTHLVGVQSVLRHWEASDDVCKAGLFHSIYGTEGFQGFKLPLNKRADIRKLIGVNAERLVWIFCMVDRKSVDDTLYMTEEDRTKKIVFRSRVELGNFPIELTGEKEWLQFIELSLVSRAIVTYCTEAPSSTSTALLSAFQRPHLTHTLSRRTGWNKLKELLQKRILYFSGTLAKLGPTAG